MEEKFRGDVESFWGSCDREEEEPTGNCGININRWYSSYIILAVPDKNKFSYLCDSGLKEGLYQLSKEFEDSSPKFKEHFNTFLNRFSTSSYLEDNRSYYGRSSNGGSQSENSAESDVEQSDWKSINKVMNMLIDTADSKLTSLFLSKILGSRKSWSWRHNNNDEIYGLFPDLPIYLFIQLLQSVPWQRIKKAVFDVISNCPTSQYTKWFDIVTQSGILDWRFEVFHFV